MKAYNEASGGLRWKFRPLSVDVGYRYMQMEGKDGRRDNTGRWPLCRCRSELLTLRKGAFRPLYLFLLAYPTAGSMPLAMPSWMAITVTPQTNTSASAGVPPQTRYCA